jgi:predicted TIM-barrel fold metal-dependent hydrolase
MHVQAGWHAKGPLAPVGETTWVAGLPFGRDGAPQLRGIIGEADPRDANIGTVLDAHAAVTPLFRGIRFMAAWHPDKHVRGFFEEPGLYRSPSFLKGFAAVADRKLTFDAWLFSHQLDDLAVLAKEYPETTIVLDHYGSPVGWAGPQGGEGKTPAERKAIDEQWREAISRLSEFPNVVAKHSGLAFPPLGLPNVTHTRAQLAEIVAPLVDHTTDAFGSDRLMFGSNYPMDKVLAPYEAVVGALLDVLAPRGEGVLRKVFRENAVRFYGL